MSCSPSRPDRGGRRSAAAATTSSAAAKARDLAARAVARRLPLARSGIVADPRPHRGDQGRADRVRDPSPLELGEEVLAQKPSSARRKRRAPAGTRRRHSTRKRLAPVEAAAWPLRSLPCSHSPRLADKAEQRVPGDLAGVGAAGALPRARRAVVLDQRRVEIECHRSRSSSGCTRANSSSRARSSWPIWPRLKRARKRPSVVGSGTAWPAAAPGPVSTEQRRVVETLAARDSVSQSARSLARRVTTPALLDRDRVSSSGSTERHRELAHQHEPSVRSHLLRRGGDLDQRRPPCYLHLQECLPALAGRRRNAHRERQGGRSFRYSPYRRIRVVTRWACSPRKTRRMDDRVATVTLSECYESRKSRCANLLLVHTRFGSTVRSAGSVLANENHQGRANSCAAPSTEHYSLAFAHGRNEEQRPRSRRPSRSWLLPE